jgi:hypothetical protein
MGLVVVFCVRPWIRVREVGVCRYLQVELGFRKMWCLVRGMGM